MALFGKKKNTETKVAPAAEASVVQNTKAAPVRGSLGGARSTTHVLRHARITEKASMHQSQGVYVFDVASAATKRDVMQAVRALYNVTPRKIAMVPVPSKKTRSMRTGERGVKRGGKKAYVFLKSGETITIA